MDRTLVRQLRALGIDPDQPVASPEVLARLLGRISTTYAIQRALRARLREPAQPDSASEPESTGVRFERFFELASDAMFTATLDGYITSANQALADITGIERSALIGRPFASIATGSSLEGMLAMRRAMFRERDSVTRYEVDLLRADGGVAHVELATQFARLGGRPHEILGVARDIGERRAREVALREQAERDALTGLPNRMRLLAELEETIAELPDATGALAMVDLDRFKEINDNLGHEAGDRVLVAVARAMERVAAPHTVARIAGDEFVVLMHRVTPGEATAVAERLRTAVADTQVPARGDHIRPEVSIGVAMISRRATPQAILAAADAMLYEAKQTGRNCVVVEATSDRHRRDFDDFLLADQVFEAIGDDRLDLAFQPIVNLATGEPEAHRAVLRMRHHDGTVTSHDAFANAMDRVGALPTVDRCSAALVLQALRDHPTLRIVLRISAATVADGELFEVIEEALRDHPDAAPRLVIEIADLTPAPDQEARRSTLERLRRRGCGIALCESGTGSSVLSIAREVPLSAITFGAMLTQSLPDSSLSRAVAFAARSMADALGIETIADGIDTPEHLAVARELGIRLGAGALLGRVTRLPVALVARGDAVQLAEAS